MPQWHQLSFTSLQLKGLWIRATGGTTEHDEILDRATDEAVDKLYRAEKGMGKKPGPPPAAGYKNRFPSGLSVERKRPA